MLTFIITFRNYKKPINAKLPKKMHIVSNPSSGVHRGKKRND